jgi:hypothetical protein
MPVSRPLLLWDGSYQILKGEKFLHVSPEWRREQPSLPARDHSRTDKVNSIPRFLNHIPHSSEGKKPQMSFVEHTVFFVYPTAREQSKESRIMPDVRDAAHERAAVMKHGSEATEHLLRVNQVLKDVRTDDAIERLGRERPVKGFQICDKHFVKNGTREIRHCSFLFNSRDAASGERFLQMLAKAACAAAHIENRTRRRRDQCGDVQPLVEEVSRVGNACHGPSQKSS